MCPFSPVREFFFFFRKGAIYVFTGFLHNIPGFHSAVSTRDKIAGTEKDEMNVVDIQIMKNMKSEYEYIFLLEDRKD